MRILETDDYHGLTEFFHRNGLEFEPGQKTPDGLVKCWGF